MDDPYLSEHDADQAAIQTLVRVIHSVEDKSNRRHSMKLIRSVNGKVYKVHEYEELTSEQITEVQQEIGEKIACLQAEMAVLSPAPTDTTPAPSAPAAPTDQSQATDGQPAGDQPAQEQPAPAPEQTPAPAEQVVNQEQPAPADPTADPNAAPFDPNAVHPLQ